MHCKEAKNILITRRIPIFVYLTALVAVGLVFIPTTSFAKKHPAKMPVTLLDLYRQSDAIFEARYARTEEGEVIRQEADYKVLKTKKHFDIYSTIKGSSAKFFELTEEEYRYSHAQSGSILLASAVDSDAENTYGLRSGDTVLLFVKYGEDGKSLELTDDEEGLKKISSDDIAVYQKRIAELAALFSSEKVSAERVVEWLVRCAEEPATRWEGTFELVKGFERLEYLEKQQRAAAEKPEDNHGMIVTDEIDTLDSSAFARVMTVDQKSMLANVLLAQKPSGDGTRTMVRGDRELIDLVKHWGDPRLAGFLLDELRTKELTDYRRSETMRLIADILRDPKISGLAAEYSNAYRDEAIAAELFKDQVQSGMVTLFSEKDTTTDFKQVRNAIAAKFIKRAASVVIAQLSTGN